VPLRVLIIEDNPDSADSLQLLLQVLGHQVRVARTGPAGLEEARGWLPEVVLCDIGLPGGLDGYGVAAALRRDPATTKARLIAITGYGGEQDRELARRAGFDHHLTKPAEPEALLRLLAPA
jgi:CheY-like chemotaxis protein